METNESTDAQAMLKRFYRLQEERVQTYKLFQEGFEAYLSGAPNYNFTMYRQLVHEITQAFKGISDEIITIMENLRSVHNLNTVAACIDKVQNAEKDKLTLTAELQLTTQNRVDHPDDDQYKQECQNLNIRLAAIIKKITDDLEEMKYEAEDVYTVDR